MTDSNYRVLEIGKEHNNDRESVFFVIEVRYDDDGKVIPIPFPQPVIPHGSTLEDLRAHVAQVAAALASDVLTLADIEYQGEEPDEEMGQEIIETDNLPESSDGAPSTDESSDPGVPGGADPEDVAGNEDETGGEAEPESEGVVVLASEMPDEDEAPADDEPDEPDDEDASQPDPDTKHDDA